MIHHISRLEGQLASVKRELGKDTPDCDTASKTLLSAARSFAGLREQFVECFLDTHFVDPKKVKGKTRSYETLLSIIKG